MDEQELTALLFTLLPSPAYIAGAVLFGILGFIAYRFGKKTQRQKTKWLGVALMFYPYLIGSDTRLLYLVGTALCIAIYFYRES
ncbi:hypothetical protein [Undibacterium sp. TJN19]|uniref:hypothetical protein n=1 Tax=Undibacterium sp. TJN19 TaxID=3413055 RepID=UPI003BF19573